MNSAVVEAKLMGSAGQIFCILVRVILKSSFAPSTHTVSVSSELLSHLFVCLVGFWSPFLILVFLKCLMILGCPFIVKSDTLRGTHWLAQVSGVWDSWSEDREFDPHVGCGDYINK